MKASVEISYYPLNEEFVPAIVAFLERINKHPELKVVTNGMSTQIFGEYKTLMGALTQEMEVSFENPHSVFIMKIVNADLQTYQC